MHKKNSQRQRQGAVTVEMAIAVPILFLMVFAALEFCGMNVMRHSVDNAAYEGARRGIVPGATVADVETQANLIMAAAGATNIVVDVVPPVITNDIEELTVTITVPVADNGWITPIFFDRNDVLVGSCHMLREEL